jgi:hypothetical protein
MQIFIVKEPLNYSDVSGKSAPIVSTGLKRADLNRVSGDSGGFTARIRP